MLLDQTCFKTKQVHVFKLNLFEKDRYSGNNVAEWQLRFYIAKATKILYSRKHKDSILQK